MCFRCVRRLEPIPMQDLFERPLFGLRRLRRITKRDNGDQLSIPRHSEGFGDRGAIRLLRSGHPAGTEAMRGGGDQ